MNSVLLAFAAVACAAFAVACKQQPSDNEAIRAGIMQHLNGVGTLNMNSMDMDIRSISINGNQAHAEVVFRPKNGGQPGAGMQVAYNLERRAGAWVVQKSQNTGGMIQHPDPGANRQNPDVHSSSVPNFSDILSPQSAPAQGALPPGHPPINAQAPSAQPGATNQTPTKKPL